MLKYCSHMRHFHIQNYLFFFPFLGRISVWQEKSPNVVQCFFNIPRELWISDMAIHRAGLLLISREGFAFHATHQTRSALNNQVSSEQDLSMKKQHIAKNTVSCLFIIDTGIVCKGPSINYVVSNSAIFDTLPPLGRLFTK